MALEIGEHPVAVLVSQLGQRFGKISLIIHTLLPFPLAEAPFLEEFHGACRGVIGDAAIWRFALDQVMSRT